MNERVKRRRKQCSPLTNRCFEPSPHDKVKPCHSPAENPTVTPHHSPLSLELRLSISLWPTSLASSLSPFPPRQDSQAILDSFCSHQGLDICTSVMLNHCFSLRAVPPPGTFLKFCGGNIFIVMTGGAGMLVYILQRAGHSQIAKNYTCPTWLD